MKTLFWTGLVCVLLGLVSFLVNVPYVQQQRFQRGSIQLGGPRSEERSMPGALGGIFIVGGLGLMVVGCRNCVGPK
jgi:hypothetical protein